MVLFVLLSPLLALQSYLTENLIGAFNFVLTTKALTTSLLRISIRSHSLVNLLIDWNMQSDLPS